MKITRLRDWCDIDQIDGKDIKPGTLVTIHWPDGSVSVDIIEIMESKNTVCDMGHDYDCPVRKAGVTKNVMGIQTFIKIPEGTRLEEPTESERSKWEKAHAKTIK